MISALATLAFLAAAWLAVQAIASTLDGKLDRISGALAPQTSEPLTLNEWAGCLPRSLETPQPTDPARLRAAA